MPCSYIIYLYLNTIQNLWIRRYFSHILKLSLLSSSPHFLHQPSSTRLNTLRRGTVKPLSNLLTNVTPVLSPPMTSGRSNTENIMSARSLPVPGMSTVLCTVPAPGMSTILCTVPVSTCTVHCLILFSLLLLLYCTVYYIVQALLKYLDYIVL